MSKTVWIINHYALTPSQGGLSRHFYFAKKLLERGYTVRIFSSSAIHNTSINMIDKKEKHIFKDVPYEGVNYSYIKSPSYSGNGFSRIRNMLDFACNLHKIWKEYRWEKPDVILTSTPDLFTARSAEKFAKKHKLPCVVEVRDLWPLSIVEYKDISNSNPAIQMLYSLEKKIYSKANALIFTMQGGNDYVVDKGWTKKVNPSKIFNVNNGIDIKEQSEQRKQFTIDDEDLNDGRFKVIYAGSIRTANSVDLLVKAAEMLKDREDISFLIYGDGDKRSELETYCKERGLERVRFKGKVDKKYIPYICSKASINFVSVKQTGVSKYGVSWNKLFDYMAAGKPILSNVAVNYDLILKYECGLSLTEQTPQAIADAVIQIYDLPSSQYDVMCQNAAQAAEDFDYELLTDKLEKAIDYAIENHRR